MPQHPWIRSVIAALFGAACTLAIFTLMRKDPKPLVDGRDEQIPPAFTPLQERSATSPPPVTLPAKDTRLRDTFRLLEKNALAGSANAACRLSQDIRRCSTRSDILFVAEDLAKFPAPPNSGPSFSETLINQSDADNAFCSEVSPEQLKRGYLFQSIAANSGERKYARWLVFSPALSQQDYLESLDEWKNYRQRAERYVTEAMKIRDADDLLLLLLVYAPKNVQTLRPPYRIDDFQTFLALMEVAKQNHVAVPTELLESADLMGSNITPDERASVNRKLAELAQGWKLKKTSGLPYQQYGEYNSTSLCQN